MNHQGRTARANTGEGRVDCRAGGDVVMEELGEV